MQISDRVIALLFVGLLLAIVLVGIVTRGRCGHESEPLADYRCQLTAMRREWCVRWAPDRTQREACILSAEEALDDDDEDSVHPLRP